MIIEKGLGEGSIITIKLTSGEEVVAKLVEESDTYIKVLKPMVLTAAQQGIGMAPYLFTINPAKEIKINKPVSVFDLTDEEMAKQYIKATTNIII